MKQYLLAAGLLYTLSCQGQTPGLDLYKDSPAYRKHKAQLDSVRELDKAAAQRDARDLSQLYAKDSLARMKAEADPGLARLDAKYGFRDAKFEMLPTQIKGLVPLSSKSIHGVRIYKRPTDSKKIGAYSVYEITYTFFQGRLSEIVLKTDGFTNSQGVRAAFKSLYGEPFQSNPYIEDYAWLGDKVSIIYSKEPLSDDATIRLWSNKMQSFEEEANEKAAKKAGSDL